MSDGVTALERMEKQAELTFGGPKPLGGGMVDHILLEMSDTNKWIHSEEQSNLRIGVIMLHDILVMTDNARNPVFRNVKDQKTGEFKAERVYVDNWSWILKFNDLVMTNQLTYGGYSRQQFMEQARAQSLLARAESEPGLVQVLGSLGK